MFPKYQDLTHNARYKTVEISRFYASINSKSISQSVKMVMYTRLDLKGHPFFKKKKKSHHSSRQ